MFVQTDITAEDFTENRCKHFVIVDNLCDKLKKTYVIFNMRRRSKNSSRMCALHLKIDSVKYCPEFPRKNIPLFNFKINSYN